MGLETAESRGGGEEGGEGRERKGGRGKEGRELFGTLLSRAITPPVTHLVLLLFITN